MSDRITKRIESLEVKEARQLVEGLIGILSAPGGDLASISLIARTNLGIKMGLVRPELRDTVQAALDFLIELEKTAHDEHVERN